MAISIYHFNKIIKSVNFAAIHTFFAKVAAANNFSKAVEKMISVGDIKNKRELILKLYYSDKWLSLLNLRQEMSFLFGVSDNFYIPLADAPPDAWKLFDDVDDLLFTLMISPHPLCTRCRLHSATVDDYIDYKTGQVDMTQICERCVQNILGTGEIRRYV